MRGGAPASWENPEGRAPYQVQCPFMCVKGNAYDAIRCTNMFDSHDGISPAPGKPLLAFGNHIVKRVTHSFEDAPDVVRKWLPVACPVLGCFRRFTTDKRGLSHHLTTCKSIRARQIAIDIKQRNQPLQLKGLEPFDPSKHTAVQIARRQRVIKWFSGFDTVEDEKEGVQYIPLDYLSSTRY